MKKLLISVFFVIALSITSEAFVCEGDGFFADPTDCAKFYRCVTGTKYSFDCGPGTHFNPNCDCCDWPSNVNCKASGGEDVQPARYKKPAAKDYGQEYGQSGSQSGNQFRQYGQQPSGHTGQDLNQNYWQQSGQSSGQYGQQSSGQPVQGSGQYGQRPSAQTGQSSGQYGQQSSGQPVQGSGQYGKKPIGQTGQDLNQNYWQQSGQGQYGQPSSGQDVNQQYWQRIGQQSGQSSGQTGQSGQTYRQKYGQPSPQSGVTYDNSEQQPSDLQYGEYGPYVPPQTQTRQRHQSHRLPEESQVVGSRQQLPGEDDRSPNQRPNRVYGRRQNPKTDRREEPIPRETDDIYEEPKSDTRVRPKPRTQPKTRVREDNILDEEFDHKFDEPIEEQRPKPRPRPRTQPQSRRMPQRPERPTTEEPDEDEDEEVLTTIRPRVPKRKHRVRITTTESDVSEEDAENEFLKFAFEDKENKQRPEDEDTNKWLQFEDMDSKSTTTEDPYVSALKERVPPQPRNRSRTDRNRDFDRHSGSTPKPYRRQEEVTTVDPFDKEWADFISGKTDPNRDQTSSKSKPKDKNKKDETTPDVSYLNCTEAGKSCDVCEELDWIKYSETELKSTPFRSLKFSHPKITSRSCYKTCSETQQCIAFSYSETSGVCHIYDQLTTDDIKLNKDYNTVIKNPKNNVINEEWVHTKNGQMSGRELYSVRTNDVWDCLQECVNDMEYCMAVNFDVVESKCRVFDAYEGRDVNTVKANSISLQNLNVFEDNDEWRFDDIGHKTLTNIQPIETIIVKDTEECFYECMEKVDNKCGFITIEDTKLERKPTKLCHIYPFTSTPKWVKSKNKSNSSYAMSVPKNHSKVQTFPGYSYVGNPVEIKEGLTEEECREYAEQNCRFCRKYTSVVETKECAIFSDSALLSPALKEANYTEKSGLLSMPKDSEYLAFKRIPWKMFVTDVKPYELKGEINGQKCLQFCLQQKLCVSTALVYDTTQSSMFCYFFKDSDLKNKNITEYENVDLFVKIMDKKELPDHISNSTDDCTDGQPLESAVKNINKMNSKMNANLQERPADRDPYSYPFDPYYTGGDEETSDSEPISNRKTQIRSQRSVNRDRDSELDDNEFEQRDIRTKFRQTKEVEESEDPLEFIEKVRRNARKESVLERVPTLSSEMTKKVRQNRLDSKKITDNTLDPKKKTDRIGRPLPPYDERLGRLSDDCNDEFGFESDRCKDTEGDKDPTKMCLKIPKIIYSDTESMQSCNETIVGEDCPVVCRSGYEPTQEKIKCEKSGTRNVWKHTNKVKCKPMESVCETVYRRDVRIKAITKYPEEKLNFLTIFDTRRKLPHFSAYVHTKQNNLNNSIHTSDNDIEYLENSCEELSEKQFEISDYKESDYIPKPLLPRNAFIYSSGAQGLHNSMSNIAPMDVFTSEGPWRTLENRTVEMLKSKPGIVISGVCPQSITKTESRLVRTKKQSNQSLDIPQCFWSVYCVPFGDGVTAAAFYTENSHPISQLDKQSRVEQIRQYRDQRFILKLLGTDMTKNIWIETYNAYKNLNKGIKDFIYKCAQTDKIDAKGMAFWDSVVNGEDNSEPWQSKFKYGLEKHEYLNENTVRNEERTGIQP